MKTETPETDSHINNQTLPQSMGFVPAEVARELERERNHIKGIIDNIGDIFHLMKPRYSGHPSMDGRYPCWIVWLPKEGRAEYKNISDAVLGFVKQSEV